MDDFPYNFEKQFVDPESQLGRIAHVYRDTAGKLYNTVMNRMDIRTNSNSFYKMQILESDLIPRTYWVFRSTGRVGTEYGDKFTTGFETADGAIVDFEFAFYEQTGNQWGKPFLDVPGKFVMVETEKHAVPSKLPPEVQELMKLIFNINAMKQAMTDAALDTSKMPLGHLSKKQLEEGDACLNELEVLISTGSERSALIEPSNRFFSLVPHNFGMNLAPVLDTIDAVNKKRQLIDSLIQIETAYAMVQDSASKENSAIDNNYDQLKADIFPLSKQSDDYEMIRRYVENTQSVPGSGFPYGKLELLEVFRVSRQGEKKRYRPFKKLQNRKLLWHGSPATNFPSIIANGLRVPGIGLFFADAIEKSAHYCQKMTQNDVGLLLLSEVALGVENQNGMFVNRGAKRGAAQAGNSSKIVGNIQPNPAESLVRDDGVVVPYGKLVPQNSKFPSAFNLNGSNFYPMFNEYIVQNSAQVNIQYLVKIKFHFHNQMKQPAMLAMFGQKPTGATKSGYKNAQGKLHLPHL